jgi:glycosyltransferase involved in cell wall biosynthesis
VRFKLAGVIDEDPFDPRTWSGSSIYFFNAFKQHGVLQEAVSAQPSKGIQYLYKLASFQPDMVRWKFKYYLSLGRYRQMTRAAKRNLDRVDADAYQVILQVGAWYDMTGYKDKLVVSYHDANLATLIASPYGYPRISEAYIARTLKYERDLYQRIDLIFPMSRWLADSFIRDNGVDAWKVHPVGAGINLPYVREVKEKSYDTPRVLFVGKDFERKGGPFLLEAFARVRREIPNAELTIIGSRIATPPEGVRCVGFLSKTNSADIERLLDEYERASVFVMPSLYEPFGIVFAEAMAHRLPCIGTNICAIPEIIDEGLTGYCVPPGNSAALAARLQSLLRDPASCCELGERGFEKYRRDYTWAAVTGRICAAIENRLSGP